VAAAAAGIGAAFHIPCFRKATEISIRFAYLTIRLPPFGVFVKLSVLRLTRFRLDDSQCDHLGDIVSSERCPSLQALTLPILKACQISHPLQDSPHRWPL
jgi:hypothetical protein